MNLQPEQTINTFFDYSPRPSKQQEENPAFFKWENEGGENEVKKNTQGRSSVPSLPDRPFENLQNDIGRLTANGSKDDVKVGENE